MAAKPTAVIKMVDPGVGDTNAELGSKDWALGIRLSLEGRVKDLHFQADGVGKYLDGLVKTGGWKHLFRQDGTPFVSVEEYCTTAKPYGLGQPVEHMLAYLRLTRFGGEFKALFATNANPVERLPLVALRRDGGTQVREKTNDGAVDEYKAALLDGAVFPPVTVFFDGEAYWLADGFHRVAAHERAEVPDILAEVRRGTKRDALRFALGANGKHGLHMSPADKHRAISIMLTDDEWRGMSNRAIAKELGVDHKTVAKTRSEMQPLPLGVPTGDRPQLAPLTTGMDGRQRPSPGNSSEAVVALLADDKWATASNKAIAEHLGVSRATVAKVRKDMAAGPKSPSDYDAALATAAAADRNGLDFLSGRLERLKLTAKQHDAVVLAIQARYAELRTAATSAPNDDTPAVTDAPVHVSTQPTVAPASQRGQLTIDGGVDAIADEATAPEVSLAELGALLTTIRSGLGGIAPARRVEIKATLASLVAKVEQWAAECPAKAPPTSKPRPRRSKRVPIDLSATITASDEPPRRPPANRAEFISGERP